MNENADENPKLSGMRPEPQVSGPASPQSSQQRPSSFGSSRQSAAYYSPPPGPNAPQPGATAKRKGYLAALGILAAAGLAVGAWFALAPPVPPAPVPPAAASIKNEKTFLVSKADADPKATAYLKAMLTGGTSTASATDNPLHAVNAAALLALAKNSPQLAAGIKSDRVVLYRLYLLDFLAEDGDHAELFVDGVGLGDVYLKNAGKEFLIPLVSGTPAQMKLVATADGGGGVTVGFVSSMGEARTRILQVGDFEQWQVIMQ
ncbi:MAG: hypothetical protein ABSA16_05420 [Thermoguttaceae bacterium]|jgi:hypothetical protein